MRKQPNITLEVTAFVYLVDDIQVTIEWKYLGPGVIAGLQFEDTYQVVLTKPSGTKASTQTWVKPSHHNNVTLIKNYLETNKIV